MIDLRNKELPRTLIVDGIHYEINTDFRVWIEFERSLREDGVALYSIFRDKRPAGTDWVNAAVEFLQSPNATPRETKSGNERVFDFILDGDYIVSSFQLAYGIDLTSCNMHWHRFKALFDGLPDNTKMAKVMGYRSYDNSESNRKYADIMRDQKQVWALPYDGEDEARLIAKMLYERQNGAANG